MGTSLISLRDSKPGSSRPDLQLGKSAKAKWFDNQLGLYPGTTNWASYPGKIIWYSNHEKLHPRLGPQERSSGTRTTRNVVGTRTIAIVITDSNQSWLSERTGSPLNLENQQPSIYGLLKIPYTQGKRISSAILVYIYI